jgi:serine/threonine-protein kinase
MNKTLDANSNISHYRIISKLGEGGMGEVYLAEDTKLDRKVALKILPSELAEDKDRMSRFVREARSASALNHPNIITIHEIGESEGTHYIATEFIDGKTLNDFTKTNPLNFKSVLEIAIQIASALDEAHAAGIVHRDIKPDNVMIRASGLVKILDFGIAKLSEKNPANVSSEDATVIKPQATSPGMIIGTANYMSPEQAKGKDVDARTDIFSFGVLLYEMLSGKLPFEGESAMEMIGAILKDEPKLLPADIPAEITKIIGKCLRKDRDERYQTIKDVLIDLKDVKQDLEFQDKLERSVVPNDDENKTQILKSTTVDEIQQTTTNQTIAAQPKLNKLLAVALAGVLAIGGFFGYKYLIPNKQIESIAVMPFVNESGNADTEYLSDGMTETLIGSLSQLPNLNVKARSSVFRYKGKEIDAQTIGKELNVQAILTGRVLQRGEQLILNLELVDAKTENVIWSEQYTRKQSDLVSLQSEIARDVSTKLRTRLSGAEQNQIAKNYTANTEAYELYLKGRYQWNKRTAESVKKAIEYFNQAIEKDPSYALAYTGLADSYSELTWYDNQPSKEVYPKAKAAALRALELDDQLAEAHTALGQAKTYSDWDFAGAEIEYRRAIELNPNYPVAHYYYAEMLSQLGRHDEAVAEATRAMELDPLSPIVKVVLGAMYDEAGRIDEAIEFMRKAIEADKDFAPLRREIVYSYERKGMFDEAINEWQTAEMLAGRLSAEDALRRAAILRESYRKSGAKGYWQGRLELLNEDAKRGNVSPAEFAAIYSFLGDKEKTLEWLEKAYQQREFQILWIKIGRNYDFLRDDPRFQDLLRRVGFTP